MLGRSVQINEVKDKRFDQEWCFKYL